MVDKADEPPENILEGSIGGVGGLQPVLEDFGLEDDVEVVVPQSLNHVVLQVDFPLDVLELVDLDPQLGLPDRVTETLVRNILQLSQSGPVGFTGHRVPALFEHFVQEEHQFLLVFPALGQFLFEAELRGCGLAFQAGVGAPEHFVLICQDIVFPGNFEQFCFGDGQSGSELPAPFLNICPFAQGIETLSHDVQTDLHLVFFIAEIALLDLQPPALGLRLLFLSEVFQEELVLHLQTLLVLGLEVVQLLA